MHRAGDLLRQNDQQTGGLRPYYGEWRKGFEILKTLAKGCISKRRESQDFYNEAYSVGKLHPLSPLSEPHEGVSPHKKASKLFL